MGATVALTASLDLGDRVRRIVAFNAYDFADGVKRANLLARLVVGNVRLPVLGPITARLENKQVLAGILRGGLHDPSQMPDHYLDELRRVGRRPGYPTVARAIYRNLESLIAARARYAGIDVPVTLVYGDEDWSRPSDSQHRDNPRRPPHRPARHRPLRRARGPPRCGANPSRQSPLSAGPFGPSAGARRAQQLAAQRRTLAYLRWLLHKAVSEKLLRDWGDSRESGWV
jgi:pimeloyl-ACP methyl ester carboxylesterase